MHYRTIVRIGKEHEPETHEEVLSQIMSEFSEDQEVDTRYVTLARPDWPARLPRWLAMDMSKDAIPNIIKLMNYGNEHPVTDAETGKVTWKNLFKNPVLIDDVTNIYDGEGKIRPWYAGQFDPGNSCIRFVVPIDSDTGELFAPLAIVDKAAWDWYVVGGRWSRNEDGDQYENDFEQNRMRWKEYREKAIDEDYIKERWETICKAKEELKDDEEVNEFLDCLHHASLDVARKYQHEIQMPGYLKLVERIRQLKKEYMWSSFEDLGLMEQGFFEHHRHRQLFAPFVFEEGICEKYDSYYWCLNDNSLSGWVARFAAFQQQVSKWDDDDWVIVVDIHN